MAHDMRHISDGPPEMELLRRVRAYMNAYQPRPRASYGRNSIDLAPLFEHILRDSGETEPKDIGEAMRHHLSGKRVFELGCREGSALAFLRDHGAIVAGSGPSPAARTLLGNDALLVDGPIENMGDSEQLKRFNPDIVISSNHFDEGRFYSGTPVNFEGAIDSFAKITQHGASVYVQPTCVNESLLGPHHFELMAKRGMAISHSDSKRPEYVRTFKLSRPHHK